MKGKKMKRKKIERRENKEKSKFFLYVFGWKENENKENESCNKMIFISLL